MHVHCATGLSLQLGMVRKSQTGACGLISIQQPIADRPIKAAVFHYADFADAHFRVVSNHPTELRPIEVIQNRTIKF